MYQLYEYYNLVRKYTSREYIEDMMDLNVDLAHVYDICQRKIREFPVVENDHLIELWSVPEKVNYWPTVAALHTDYSRDTRYLKFSDGTVYNLDDKCTTEICRCEGCNPPRPPTPRDPFIDACLELELQNMKRRIDIAEKMLSGAPTTLTGAGLRIPMELLDKPVREDNDENS